MTPEKIGPYQIKSQLGKGGMATVYHGHDTRFDRDVAIKLMPREFLHDDTFLERFRREAKAIAALEHSFIVPVYDYGEIDGQPYLVMRYMGGGSLSERIREKVISLDDAVKIIKRIGAALDRAHSKGLIHRDIKPANILHDDYGDAYVGDFGIVKISESTVQLTGAGMVGTPAYMAPEMAERESTTPLVDVYALGVTLFQMLTGELPYQADTPIGTVMQHVTKPIPAILTYRDDLPPGVQQVINKAMAKDPAERFQSCGELADALEIVSRGEMLEDVPVEADDNIEQTMMVEGEPLVGAPDRTIVDESYSTPLPMSTPVPAAPTKKRKGGGLGIVLVIGLVIIVLCGAVAVIFGVVTTQQANQRNADSTATAISDAATSTVEREETLTQEAIQTADAATSTAQFNATATVNAGIEATATAIVQATINFIDGAKSGQVLFGPDSGSLEHDTNDDLVVQSCTDLDVSTFTVEAEFDVPYGRSEGSWDVGFMFRHQGGNDQYRTYIRSNRIWAITEGHETLVTDETDFVNTAVGETNIITVIVDRDNIMFILNGQYLGELDDLSGITSAGDVCIVTGFVAGDEEDGEETNYRDFTVWAYP